MIDFKPIADEKVEFEGRLEAASIDVSSLKEQIEPVRSVSEIQRVIETHEALLARTDAHVEFLRGYFERNLEGSEFARIMKCALADAGSFHAFAQSNDTGLLYRLEALAEGSGNIIAAADGYTSLLLRHLKIIGKYGGRFGKLIVSALNLFDSFLWPGRRELLYERFKECCSQQQNLISAFRRDYLDDVDAGAVVG